jgi:hypothetical protein
MAPRCVALVVAACVLSAGGAAQPTDGQFSLGGIVLNSVTGEPVKRALVQVIRYEARKPLAPGERFVPPPPPFTASTLTDLAGVFRFSALAAGDYSISAQKPGFSPQQDAGDRSSRVKLASSVEDFKLRLTPLGVMTGKVVDQAGQPLLAVGIVLLRARVEDGLRQTSTERNVSTDDRGTYRLWNLQPGKYYLKAAGRRDATYFHVGDTTPQLFPEEGFAPVYFGGGRTLDSAAPIEIEAGTEARADLALRLEPAYNIRGSLTNFVTHASTMFELLSGDEGASANRVTMDAGTGRFEVLGVVTGSYFLRATHEKAGAEATVNVDGSDVNGVSLTLAPGVDVRGLTVITNAPADAPTPDEPLRGLDSALCTVRLGPARGRSRESYVSEAGGSGEFTVRGVIAGAYRVSLECSGGYARSAMSGAQDLLADSILTIQPGAAPQPIEVVATYGGGTINGEVSAGPSSTLSSVWVLLVPQFAGSTGPVLAGAFRFPGQAGGFRFEVRDLRPGSYAAYAFLNRDDVEFRNPQFLQSLTGGVRVQAEDANKKSITITEVTR